MEVCSLSALRMPFEMSGQDVGWMAIEVVAPVVVAPGCARIGMAGSVLHVLERDPCAQGLRDKGMPEAVRCDRLSSRNARVASHALDHLVRGGVGEPLAFGPVEEQRPRCGVVIGHVRIQRSHADGIEGSGGCLATLANPLCQPVVRHPQAARFSES